MQQDTENNQAGTENNNQMEDDIIPDIGNIEDIVWYKYFTYACQCYIFLFLWCNYSFYI